MTFSRKLLAHAAVSYPLPLERVLDWGLGGAKRVTQSGIVASMLDRWIESIRLRDLKGDMQTGTGMGSLSHITRSGTSTSTTNVTAPTPSAAESEDLSTAEARKRMLSASLEAFAQCSKASIQEARLLSQDWGFRFEDVRYPGIKVWHGRNDINAPVGTVRYMVDKLPSPDFWELDADHYTMDITLRVYLSID